MRQYSSIRRALIVATAAVLAAVFSIGVASGAPYPQVFSDRYSFASSYGDATIESGGDRDPSPFATLPISDVSQTVVVPIAGGGGGGQAVWLVTPTAVASLVVSATAQQSTVSAVNFSGSVSIRWPVRVAASTTPAAVANQTTQIVLAGTTAVYWVTCESPVQCDITASADAFGSIGSVLNDAAFDWSTQTAWLATDKGLYYSTPAAPAPVSDLVVNDMAITALAVYVTSLASTPSGYTSAVAAGSAHKSWRYNTTTNRWRFEWVQCAFDDAITALSYDQADGTLWIGNNQALNAQYANSDFDRFGALNGLPAGNHTCADTSVAGASRGLWLGTATSLVFYQPTAETEQSRTFSPFRYFAGPRFLVDNSVVSVAVWHQTDTVIAVTATGLAIFTFEMMTLYDKAELLERVMPRHDMLGFGLAGGCNLQLMGNTSSWYPSSDDNNGLWTSVYLGSQCLKYAVTGSEEARQQAWKYFEGMELLNNVTNLPGLMARSVWPADQNPQQKFGGRWVNSTTVPGLAWKRDTSSDEVTGHQYVYPLMYQLVAQTPDEKARVLRVFKNQIDHIMKGGYQLLDITGIRTTWGDWSPEDMNFVEWWNTERGVNSFQILSWLTSAYLLTNDTRYYDAFMSLGVDNDYLQNIINLKMIPPVNVNFSDDELTFLPYFQFLWSVAVLGSTHTKADVRTAAAAAATGRGVVGAGAESGAVYPADVTAAVAQSLRRTWKYIKPERMSLYTYITALGLGESEVGSESIKHARVQLERWSTELIDWRHVNSVRWDLRLSPDSSRQGGPISATLIPPDENGLTKWNGGPYDFDGGSGHSEDDAGGFLLAYWMGRYLKFIDE